MGLSTRGEIPAGRRARGRARELMGEHIVNSPHSDGPRSPAQKFRLRPFPMLANQIQQSRSTASASGMLNLMACLPTYKFILLGAPPTVAKISVRHFPPGPFTMQPGMMAIFHTLEMVGARLDARRDGLQIEQRSPARRASYVIRLERATAAACKMLYAGRRDCPRQPRPGQESHRQFHPPAAGQ